MFYFNLEYTDKFNYKDADNVGYWILYNGHDKGVKDFLVRNKEKCITICFADKILENMELYSNGDKLIDFVVNEKEKFYIDLVKEGINNFVLQIPYHVEGARELAAALKENEVPFYFIDAVTSWEQLNAFIEDGVSDILISSSFAFNIKDIAEECHKKGVRVRVIPNIYQPAEYNDGSIGFFIRPNSISLYSKYVDVFELRCSKDVCNTIYEIFAIDKEWYGDISEIITGAPKGIINRNIVELFDIARVNCGKKCVKPKKNCDICNVVIRLSKTFTEYNIEYKNSKLKKE
mgnify:CR=1 FL=1